MHRLEDHWGPWVLRWRWPLVLLLPVAVLAVALSGGRHLSFTTNYRVFFSEDNPQLQAFDRVEATYARQDNVLFVLTPEDGDVFTPRTLAAVQALTERAWQLPYSTRVESITNFQHTEAEGDDLVVEDLVPDATALDSAALARVRRIALAEPLLVRRLVAPDARVTAVNVTIQLPGVAEHQEVPEVVAAARALAADLRREYPHLEVRLSGMVIMNNAFSEASQRDMKSLVPLGFALMIATLALLLRDFQGSLRGTAASVAVTGLAGGAVAAGLLPAAAVPWLLAAGVLAALVLFTRYLPATAGVFWVIVLSILFAMGTAGHVGFPITPPSASAPTIILTVAVANSVHVVVSLLHELRRGRTKDEAITESLRLNLFPVFLTSVTTALGFLSMNFSEVPPFRHLGNIVAFGVLASFILSVTFLPALISLLPVRIEIRRGERPGVMERFAEFVVRRRRLLLWGSAAVVVVLVAFIPRNELNDVFVHYFDTDIEFRRDADYTDRHLTGLYVFDYSLESGTPGGISEPAFLREVEAFARWYRERPETRHVNVITDVFKRLNKNMHGDDPAWYRLPEQRNLAAQYLLLYEMSLPYGLDLNNQINVDKSATRMVVSTRILSTREVLALKQAADEWVARNARHIKAAEATGPTVMFAYIGSRNIVSMLTGTTLALAGISLILILALRSVRMGLVSLLPNLVPAAMGFGLWGILVGEVGLALSIVTGMTLGIVVDDTVHFLSKYLRARRERGLAPPDAVRYAFHTVGRALVFTSVVLIVGFGILALSSFHLNSGMGMLTAMVIAFALAADFLLLPVLLMKFEEKADAKTRLAADTDPAAA